MILRLVVLAMKTRKVAPQKITVLWTAPYYYYKGLAYLVDRPLKLYWELSSSWPVKSGIKLELPLAA